MSFFFLTASIPAGLVFHTRLNREQDGVKGLVLVGYRYSVLQGDRKDPGCPHWLVYRTFQAVFPHTFWQRKKKPHPPLPPRYFPNPIRLAQRWQKLINEGVVSSQAQLARNLGCSRARVTQILSLLKLPTDEIELLAAKGEFLSDKNLCERKLRELKKKQIVLPSPNVPG